MAYKDNTTVEPKERLKYRPTKIGKAALFTAIISLSLGLLCILLSGLSVIGGMIVPIAIFLFHAVALLALLVVMIDVGKFNKYNRPV